MLCKALKPLSATDTCRNHRILDALPAVRFVYLVN